MNLIKDLEYLAYDLRILSARLSENKRAADRALKSDEDAAREDYNKTDRLSWLFDNMADAYYDFDRRLDEVREIEERLLDLIESVEYNEIRNQAVEKNHAY